MNWRNLPARHVASRGAGKQASVIWMGAGQVSRLPACLPPGRAVDR
ncbi:MAG: hypothetical protein KJ666_06040 [Bacteroidetes bacterium]|nr:hypothetical protein [Bacteroidota bacterium]